MCSHAFMQTPKAWSLPTPQLRSVHCQSCGADPESSHSLIWEVSGFDRASCSKPWQLILLLEETWKHGTESATPAVFILFMLFQLSSEVQPALHSFLPELFFLPVGPQAWTMQPQQNKDYVLNYKNVSIYASCNHLVHRRKTTFSRV